MTVYSIGYFVGVDPAAGLVRDGEIISFVEEERLIRDKHAIGRFPIRAIAFLLQQNNLTLKDIAYFAYGWDTEGYENGRVAAAYDRINEKYPPNDATLGWQRANLNRFRLGPLEENLHLQLRRFFGHHTEFPPLRTFPHHKSHAASAFYASPFDDALVFTLDGSGDTQTGTLWHGKGAELHLVDEISIPHSMGWLYAAITEFLGFAAYDGEYKVMGLASYGHPNKDLTAKLEQICTLAEDGVHYHVDPKYIFHGGHTHSQRFSDHMIELLDMLPRLGEDPLTQQHQDLAYAVQELLERRIIHYLRHYCQQKGIRRLCMAGGVTLNVKLNSKLHYSDFLEDLYILPFPSDSSCGVGAAMGIFAEDHGQRPPTLKNAYLGPSYTDEQIELQIKSIGLEYQQPQELSHTVATMISEGQVIGWFQGALEAGPRALGGRSILADPRSVDARDRVNSAVKFREYWRPFCPSIRLDAIERYAEDPTEAPYMILAFRANEQATKEIPGVVHVDGTMRVQTVNEVDNPPFAQLLSAFEDLTGIPVLLNTSFNIKGEPIVCSPRDALRTFFSTGLDALVLGPFVIQKPKVPMRIEPEQVVR